MRAVECGSACGNLLSWSGVGRPLKSQWSCHVFLRRGVETSCVCKCRRAHCWTASHIFQKNFCCFKFKWMKRTTAACLHCLQNKKQWVSHHWKHLQSYCLFYLDRLETSQVRKKGSHRKLNHENFHQHKLGLFSFLSYSECICLFYQCDQCSHISILARFWYLGWVFFLQGCL